MKENQKKAFDFAADTTKQLITIATAIITLTVTFSKDILGGAQEPTKVFLIITWAVFIFSIVMGVVTLMALTGRLHPMKASSNNQATGQSNANSQTGSAQVPSTPSSGTNINPPATVPTDNTDDIHINHGNIRLFSILQALFFCVGIILTGVFGYKSLHLQSNAKKSNTYLITRQSTLNGDTTKIYIDTLYVEKK